MPDSSDPTRQDGPQGQVLAITNKVSPAKQPGYSLNLSHLRVHVLEFANDVFCCCDSDRIEIDKHISSDFLTISINQKARHCKVEKRLKTPAAFRDVDLHPAIASLLKDFVGDRKSGFLFTSRNGKPLSSSNVIRRHLHPALKELGYVNPYDGTHKAGNHAFRRFRNTYLKNYTDCPKGLYDYWMGHAGKDMSDLCDKIKEDVAFRKMWAEKSGFGFELPSVVPNVPKPAEKTEAAKAA